MVHWKAPLPSLAFPSGAPQIWRPIRDETVSDVGTYDLTWAEDIALLWLQVFAMTPVTNGVTLYARTSGDGGSTWDAGASDYQYHSVARVSALGLNNSAGAAQMLLNPASAGTDIGNQASYGVSGNIFLLNPGSGKQTNLLAYTLFRNGGGNANQSSSQATRKSVAAVDGLRLFFSSGNINTGRFLSRGLVAYGDGP